MDAEKDSVNRVLSLLRVWGWETGLEKLKAEIKTVADEERRSSLSFFAAVAGGERSPQQESGDRFKEIEELPVLLGWARAGLALAAFRQHDYEHAHRLLDQATALGEGCDPLLTAAISHHRGALFYHQGDERQALSQLHEALSLFGGQHFSTGRVLDTLGMVYMSKDNFHAAREFFERSIECKRRFEDEAGLAISHGQLGRLYLEWEHVRKAEEHFKQDLELARRIDDEHGEAQMYNYLGQTALIQRRWEDAAAWLEESIRLSEQKGWNVLEGFARKDRSIAFLRQEQLAEAEVQIQKADDLFRAVRFVAGLAHVQRTRAMIWRAQEKYDEAESALREALTHFEAHKERAEATRTQLEKARVLRARGVPRPLIKDALCNALERAEQCRRDALVREIEGELCEVDEAAYYQHIYSRSRGRKVSAETGSLLSGERESATILFLDVQGSTEYARTSDPEVVMMTLNQMMAGFEKVLDCHQALVTAYLGDGFMALLRGTEHAKRGVLAALEMVEALREFNLPREVLGLKPLNVRIGISSGEVFIGNVGTYHKMDFTAIGTTANLAARLQNEAEPGLPCISRATFEQVQDKFIFRSVAPRLVSLKGLGQQEAWDVLELSSRPA